ncbi:peroxiredoxin-like family protein [Nocardia sp. NPDC052316]|uniref:peroxiredoxin-like family protein n=1 Tax=Nocardia sp. NPDC052316 TaxID=3364329 RepID=UPI0037C7D85D
MSHDEFGRLRQMMAELDELQAELAQTHIRSAAIVTANSVRAGHTLPDFTLLDEDGEPTKLSEVAANSYAVLVFYRGAWSLPCAEALCRYQHELLPELTGSGVRLIGISPQAPEGSAYTRFLNSLEFPLLSDLDNVVARALGIGTHADQALMDAVELGGYAIGNRNAEGEWELPIPSTLIIDRSRTVRFIDVRVDDMPRTEPMDILAELRS